MNYKKFFGKIAVLSVVGTGFFRVFYWFFIYPA